MEVLSTLLSLIKSILLSIFYTFVPASYLKKDVKDDIVLITGAGSGIGRIMAIRFSKLGAKVVLWDINNKANMETAKLIQDDGLTAFPYTCDVSNREEIYKTAEKVKKEVGIVTILINNAGIVVGKPLLDTPDHMIVKTFEVNSLSHFWTVKAFLPDMLSIDKGHIVTISSLAGYLGTNRMVDYCASKAAAVVFTDGLRHELQNTGKNNINVTLICPSYMDTGMFEGAKSPLVRPVKPEAAANQIVEEILTNSRFTSVPKFYYLLVVCKILLPYRIAEFVQEVAGAGDFMSSFSGRNNAVKTD